MPRDDRWKAAATVAPALAAGLLVDRWAVSGSIGAGRSFAQVERLLRGALRLRHARRSGAAVEELVFVGWLTPLLALAGLVAIRERRGLALVLGLAALVPCLLALGANLPGYETLWRVLPGLDSTRVPERFMPIACLALAALVGVRRRRWSCTLQLAQSGPRARRGGRAVVVLAVDLRVPVFGAVAADEPSAAYAAIRGDGRLLELPVFRPDLHYGSVYLGYARQSPRERPQGYSTLAPPAADRLARELRGSLLRPRRDSGPTSASVSSRSIAASTRRAGFFGPGVRRRAPSAMLRSGRVAASRP